MRKLTNPTMHDVQLRSGRTIRAGETVEVTDEEYATAGPLFLRGAPESAPTVRDRKTRRRASHGSIETTAMDGGETR